MTDDYSDIINLPHPEPRNHPRITMQARAAQFAPFAALTGHGAAIEETARLTESEVELGDDTRQLLDRKLSFLLDNLQYRPRISITYFLPDQRKAGGSYRSATSSVTKVDGINHIVYLEDGTQIPLQHVIDIEGEIFEQLQ